MSKFYDKPSSDLLYQALLQVHTLEECRQFLQDLCTVSELKAMEQRMEVAMLLDQGLIYSEILERTGREPVSKHVVGLDGLIGHGQAVHIPQFQKDLTVVHREVAVKNHPAPQQGEAGQPQHDLAHPPQAAQPGFVEPGQLLSNLHRVAHL